MLVDFSMRGLFCSCIELSVKFCLIISASTNIGYRLLGTVSLETTRIYNYIERKYAGLTL